ncbi:MAG: 6-phosphofructokinase, partial [Dehalococcoidia bacterium]
MRKIGILASGGDSPGMNACIRAATRTAIYHGIEMVGVWDGFNGLVEQRLEPLPSRAVAGILQRGGSVIGAGRCSSFRDAAVQREAIAYMRSQGIEGLIVIGGDGSMAGARELHKLGFPTVTVPGTIDNDMPGTEITIGSDTAINTAMEAIDRLRDTASSHNRAMIVEVMGRHCGYIAIMAGLATGAEMVITPERHTELTDIFREMEDERERGKRHFIVVLAEGAQWKAAELAGLINEAPNQYEARYTVLGYVQRGGIPSRFDRILATRMGVTAVDALLDGKSGVLVTWNNNRCTVQEVESLAPHQDPWNET